MKFTFDKNALLNEIAIAQEIISTKTSISVLSNVLLIAEQNSLTIKATDLKVNFQTKIPVDVEEEGSITVLCDKLMGILNALPDGEIEFFLQDKDNMVIAVIRHSTKKIKYQLNCTSEHQFPEIAIAEEVSFFDVPAKELKEMITQTTFAASVDDDKIVFNGVCVKKDGDKLILVATNRHRLAYAEKNILAGIPDFPESIVHPKVLNIVAKHSSDEGSVSLAIVDRMIFFKFANYEFSSTLIDGKFPAYERLIDVENTHKFMVLKSEFVAALKRISIMLDKIGRITLNLSPGVLSIVSLSPDLGEAKEDIPCQYDGEEFSVPMKYQYIEGPLKVMETENIVFEFSDVSKPFTLRPEPAADYRHILMSMAVS